MSRSPAPHEVPQPSDSYRVLPFPVGREVIIDAGYLSARRHLVHGLFELDVTGARECIHRHRDQTGEALSFTAFLTVCLARAVVDHPHLNAYRNWRRQLIVFDDVDVVVLVEPQRDAVAVPHIVRAANLKTIAEISAEIRAVQANPAGSPQAVGRAARLAMLLPRFVRLLLFHALMRRPLVLKRRAGTVVLTAVGMFGQGGGWGIGGVTLHTLALLVGGMATRPAFVEGQVVPREFLAVTMSIDHDVVDGAPAARFARRFRELVESSYGLPLARSSADAANTPA